MDPINYQALVPQVNLTPKVALLNDQMQQLAQQNQAKQMMEQYRSDLQSAFQNPTKATFAQLIAKYPAQREALKDSMQAMSEDQLNNEFREGAEISNALENNRPDVAQAQLKNIVEARKNSGLPYSTYQMVHDAIERGDIKHAQGMTNFILSAADPDRFNKLIEGQKGAAEAAKTGAEAVKAQYEAANTPTRLDMENQFKKGELSNLYSQINERSGRLALDRDKLQSDVEMKMLEMKQKTGDLPDDARKLINDNVVSASANKLSAQQTNDLADRIQKEGRGWGKAGGAIEWFKQATGNENYLSELRREYVKFRALNMKSVMPAGPASDKDVQNAMAAFPSENASPEMLSSFMRGMAKMSQVAGIMDDAKAEWAAENRTLGKATKDINISGIQVPKGTNFSDFVKGYVDKKYNQENSQNIQQQVQSGQRSYLQPR